MKLDSIKRLWLTGLAAPLLLSGCSLTSPLDSDEQLPITHESERAPSSEIWRALARAVDAGTIDSTTRLAQFVVVLGRNGDLTSTDANAFDVAFPHAIQDSRSLTTADVGSLVELARQGK